MSNKRRPSRAQLAIGALAPSAALSTVLLLALPAQAQLRRPLGIRISNVAVNPNNLTVDFDVTLFTTGPAGATGLLGNNLFVTTGGGGSPTGVLLNPVINAIDHGDGVVIPATTLPPGTPSSPAPVFGVTTNSYVGSFAHTYPALGTYNLRVGAAGLIAYTNTISGHPFTIPTANAVTQNAGSFSYFNGIVTTNVTFAGAFNYIVGITNVVPVIIAFGVPTMPEVGVLLLALALLTAGMFMLRRSPSSA